MDLGISPVEMDKGAEARWFHVHCKIILHLFMAACELSPSLFYSTYLFDAANKSMIDRSG
jgi:hypothetical protein